MNIFQSAKYKTKPIERRKISKTHKHEKKSQVAV